MSDACRQSALRFLKIRPRSTEELRGKLEGKGFEAGLIKETLRWLQEIRLLDDRTFTKSWIQYRLSRPFGFRRIALELKAKGIDPGLIEEEIAQAQAGTDELTVALSLAERRVSKLENVDPLKRKKRISDFLVRRGYPLDIVMKVIRQL